MTKKLIEKYETTTAMAHASQIKEVKTLCLPIEEDWRKENSEDNDLKYVERILYIIEEM